MIGAGPAGLMAAERLAASGASVTVYDRMASPGRKFLLAGRGGLNLTHSEPLAAFLGRYRAPAVETAVAGFTPDDLRAWCAGLGQACFVGSSGRVFPSAFKATPLLRAWLARLHGAGVRFSMRRRWLGWDAAGALRFEDGEPVQPAATVLALGGASWPRLGSDGSWIDILRDRRVAVTPLRPANGGVVCGWSPVFAERFAGQPLKRIEAWVGAKAVRGEAVVTADGLEGGVVYALSREIRAALDAGGATLTLDLRPDLDAAALSRRMGGSGVSRANAWRRAGLSPAAAGLLREVGGEPKRAVVPIAGLQPVERAISTAGGVALDAVDPRFMLRALPGVFVAGEMLDWEAPTGGYLLQGCFSTGVAAAAGAMGWAR